ncbi:MAG: flagellar filament outer layer protein FlaA [Treponema sp.]|nr:flagellar filament outer layer protein FlaA [Treponema sp.]
MKHSSFKIICLIIWACLTVFSAYGQTSAVTLESRILESFNGDDNAPYIWKTDSSRFISALRNPDGSEAKDDNGITKRYPITAYVDAWPIAVFGYNRTPDSPAVRSLGLNGQFDRMGYNWIDLYPVLADDPEGKPYEIPIPGIVKNIDLWVWGSNLRYYIEIFVRDYRGVVHPIRLGDISYPGWRNLDVNVPSHIAQIRHILPSYAGLTFVKFRIWTQPSERVNNFYIYFKQLKVLTDMYNPLYDGNDLSDPAVVDRIWSGN